MLTQLLQFVFGYSPLQRRIRARPHGRVVHDRRAARPAARRAHRLEARGGVRRSAIFAVGLVVLSLANVDSGFGIVLVATLTVGVGFGFTLAPTTDAVMGAVPREKAGMASGTLSATRQVATAIGVAVVGSLLVSGYRSELASHTRGLGLSAADRVEARTSLGSALAVAHDLGGAAGRTLTNAGSDAFIHGMRLGLIVCAVMLTFGALLALRYLPARARDAHEHEHEAPGSPGDRRPHRMTNRPTSTSASTSCCSISAAVLVDFGGVGPMRELSGIDSDDELWRRWLTCRWVRSFERGGCSPEDFAAGVVSDWALPITPDEFLDGFSNWLGGPLAGSTSWCRRCGHAFPSAASATRTRCTGTATSRSGRCSTDFDHRFLSFELGLLKPDREIFDRVGRTAGGPDGPHPVPRRQRAQCRRRHRGRVPGRPRPRRERGPRCAPRRGAARPVATRYPAVRNSRCQSRVRARPSSIGVQDFHPRWIAARPGSSADRSNSPGRSGAKRASSRNPVSRAITSNSSTHARLDAGADVHEQSATLLGGAHERVDDVVDEHVVARLLAVAVDRGLLPLRGARHRRSRSRRPRRADPAAGRRRCASASTVYSSPWISR